MTLKENLMDKKRIILFDDDAARRDSLTLLINMCPDLSLVAVFENGESALDHVHNYNPDLILMDLDMPKVNGVQATESIRQEFPLIPIIIQTIFEDEPHIFEAVKAGATGYLLKSTPPEKFLDQIQDALQGGAPMTGTIAHKILNYFKNEPINKDFGLSEREKQILKLLVDGYSYKMIAQASSISYFTVCNHIKKIYFKLQVNSATEAVSIAIKSNFFKS